MAEANRNDRTTSVPDGLLAGLSEPSEVGNRPDEVARGRRHAADRRFDDGEVVDEIASRILSFSHP